MHVIHSITKILSSISEMTIFVILGIVAAVSDWKRYFDWGFSLTALLFCTIFRPLFTIFLTWLLNFKRTRKMSWKDQFIMSFSGLRGGIAFSLMALTSAIKDSINEEAKHTFLLTTIFIVFFTSFVQGSTCGPLVNFFKIEKTKKAGDQKLSAIMHEKAINYLVDGVVAICGQVAMSNYTAVNKFEELLARRVNPYFLRVIPEDQRELNSNDIAEIWFKELTDDYQSQAKAVTTPSVMHRNLDQNQRVCEA